MATKAKVNLKTDLNNLEVNHPRGSGKKVIKARADDLNERIKYSDKFPEKDRVGDYYDNYYEETASDARDIAKATLEAATPIRETFETSFFRPNQRTYGLPEIEPEKNKGAIILETDAGPVEIFFSRYPTEYTLSVEANLGRAQVPGANTETFQKLGAKASTYKMTVLFHNAWLGPQFMQAERALQLLTLSVKELWRSKTYWKLGARPPMPIIIVSINFKVADFAGGGAAKAGRISNTPSKDDTQNVIAEIEFVKDEGTTVVIPYKPRRSRSGRRGRKNSGVTPVEFVTDSAREIIEGVQAGSAFVADLWGSSRSGRERRNYVERHSHSTPRDPSDWATMDASRVNLVGPGAAAAARDRQWVNSLGKGFNWPQEGSE